jgi:uncharacterized Zn-finger protein
MPRRQGRGIALRRVIVMIRAGANPLCGARANVYTGPMAKVAPEPPETILVETRTVACDGGGGALGHPRVWLNLGADGTIDCPYCDRRFKLKPGTKLSTGH